MDFFSSDFNGDGRSDYLVTSNWTGSNWSEYQLYTPALKKVGSICNNKLIARTEYINSLKKYQYRVFTYGTTHTTERKYDYKTSQEYSTTVMRNVFDNYGNAVRNVTWYNNTDSVVNVNTFSNDENKWFLGRLQTAQVTKYKIGWLNIRVL